MVSQPSTGIWKANTISIASQYCTVRKIPVRNTKISKDRRHQRDDRQQSVLGRPSRRERRRLPPLRDPPQHEPHRSYVSARSSGCDEEDELTDRHRERNCHPSLRRVVLRVAKMPTTSNHRETTTTGRWRAPRCRPAIDPSDNSHLSGACEQAAASTTVPVGNQNTSCMPRPVYVGLRSGARNIAPFTKLLVLR